MPFKHTVRTDVSVDNVALTTSTKNYTGDGKMELDETVPASSTDQAYDIDFAAGRVISVVMQCDKDITVKTNSSSEPDDTFDLKAGVPVFWNTESQGTVIFSQDVTQLFITNAAETEARFRFSAILSQEISD